MAQLLSHPYVSVVFMQEKMLYPGQWLWTPRHIFDGYIFDGHIIDGIYFRQLVEWSRPTPEVRG